ncbi:hypothetical protein SAMN05444156_1522 [Verrucomicrobium sp. GAS474]|uniref:hypothetical protein n=1 Tax=Verrucomicrobium sp. GAS474 TaxID=1882831 RepID=UPI00087AF573|nr:hypothetical protein [Verrucomicrobium sp. GAS474]SDU02633.1 hypothetical protein SAMN05444156_1522 [Verrucomicrobium sp. GAS474]
MNRILLLLLLFPTALPAQELAGAAPDSAPVPPYVEDPPASFSWKIVHAPRPPAPDAPSLPATVHFLKESKLSRTPSAMRIVKTWSDGVTTEEWRYQSLTLFTQPNSGEIYVMEESDSLRASFATMSTSAFPEFSWINAASYVGTETYNGSPAYVFAQAAVADSPISPSTGRRAIEAHPALKAWIDVKTKLPLAYDDGVALHTYEMGQPPSTPLVPSAAFLDRIEKYKKEIASLKHERLKL